jgi:hypothetical protein
MKFLIHVQSPRRLAHQLRAAGFEAIHTLDLPQGNRTTDQEVITLLLSPILCGRGVVSANARTLEVVACINRQHRKR